MAEQKQSAGTQLAAAIDKLPANQRASELRGLLTARIANIEDVLPSNLRGTGEGQRLINRASLYFSTKKDLHNYSMASIYAAVVQSVEIGIPLDGRLGHIGSFGGDAVFMPSYIGLVMIAKRSRQIKDCYGDIVGENDHFECGRQGPVSILNHTPNLTKRGKVKGAYAVVTMPDGTWRYEYMTLEQLDHVRNKARSKNGPWSTDTEQMQIKTVIRRVLKLYVDDPTFIRALEIDEATDAIDVEFSGGPQASRVRPSPITQKLIQAPTVTMPQAGADPLPPKQEPKQTRQRQQQEESPPPEAEQSQQGGDGQAEQSGEPSAYEQLLLKAQEANTAEGFDMVEQQIKAAPQDVINDAQYEELMGICDAGRKKIAPSKRGK